MPNSSKITPVVIFIGLVLFLVSGMTAYSALSTLNIGVGAPSATNSAKTNGKNKLAAKKLDLPKTEECPINGAMLTKPERDAWEKRRPMGIMVENSKAARPQSGLSSADVVYEAVAEGGITRFMAVFYCQDSDVVGPVRSARTYYLDWISEYGSSPLYVHVGGANQPGPADALGQIDKYGWGGFNDLNQFSVGFPTFYRDYERLGKDTATEHTVYAATSKLWDFAATKRKLTNVETDDQTGKVVSWDSTYVPWKFKDDALQADRPVNFSAEFNFSNTASSYLDDYLVKWVYDPTSNSYLRFNGGAAHQDLDTNQQLLSKNVVLQFMTMTIADDGYSEEGHGLHTLYGDKGTGKAEILMDGKVIVGTWSKTGRTGRTKFFDDSGNEIKFNRGLIWIEILPIGQNVKQS